MTGILLILGAVHTGIIGYPDHQSGIHAGIGNRKKRVSRHV